MKSHDAHSVCNLSTAPNFSDIVDRRRRTLLVGAAAGVVLGVMPPGALASTAARRYGGPDIGFQAIAVSDTDDLRLPPGYVAQVLYCWGDPVGDGPEFRADAGNSFAEQGVQAGMHHDGLHYFPFDGSAEHGLLCVNHEYTDDGLLHPDGMTPWTAEKVAKSQAAHGISVIEIRLRGAQWEIVRPSPFARRITAATPIRFSGPAAGAPALQTVADPSGKTVFGTINNCAMGATPWGSYLSCEENFNGYFLGLTAPTPDQRRYGLSVRSAGYRWHEFDERFDCSKHANESNRFGWVVELDPRRPDAAPVKRTALGRLKHEGAFVTLARDGRTVVYMGDDERFEYIYKFVSAKPWSEVAAPASPLDEGVLYVARFDPNGSGRWLPLVHGTPGLTVGDGFADQADVLIRTRQAGDALGATPMDRPEWIAVHPHTGEVYCSLTNNSARGQTGSPGVDAVNPRAENRFGHIVRWRERGGDAAAEDFAWDVFVECGDSSLAGANLKGNISGDAFASPDGLWFDRDGRLWIETDISTAAIGDKYHKGFGNNQMLVADPVSGVVRRFLTGPRGCEITGITATPDGRTLFINIQHPGEPASERSQPDRAEAISRWPANQFPGITGGRPRSATVAIRRADGGVVGT